MSTETPYSYTLIRSDRKTLGLEVKADGTLLARAPRRMPLSDIDAFVRKKEAWIKAAREKVLARADSPYRQPVTASEEAELLRRGKALLAQRVPYWSAVTGLTPTGVRITHAEKRFGSCSAANSLCFSLKLFRYPEAAVDYVILHELAHIRHHNHSKAFYALLASYMPDYPAREALLRN